MEAAAARAAASDAAAAASQAVSEADTARAESEAAVTQAASEVAAARAASKAAAARASSQVASARAASKAAAVRASSELAAARAASEAATAEALRMTAECEELAHLKAKLEHLDTERKRLLAHWCDTHRTLLDYQQACHLFAEGYRRNHELLHRLQFQPSVLLLRPDLLAPSPEDAKGVRTSHSGLNGLVKANSPRAR